MSAAKFVLFRQAGGTAGLPGFATRFAVLCRNAFSAAERLLLPHNNERVHPHGAYPFGPDPARTGHATDMAWRHGSRRHLESGQRSGKIKDLKLREYQETITRIMM